MNKRIVNKAGHAQDVSFGTTRSRQDFMRQNHDRSGGTSSLESHAIASKRFKTCPFRAKSNHMAGVDHAEGTREPLADMFMHDSGEESFGQGNAMIGEEAPP